MIAGLKTMEVFEKKVVSEVTYIMVTCLQGTGTRVIIPIAQIEALQDAQPQV